MGVSLNKNYNFNVTSYTQSSVNLAFRYKFLKTNSGLSTKLISLPILQLKIY